MAGQLPSNADDAKRLRMELQRINDLVPEIREKLAAGASDDTILDVLATKLGGGLSGEIVDVPDSLVAPPQSQAQPAAAGNSDLSALTSSVAGIQAQVILIQASLDEMRDIARAWADAQGIGG